MRIHIIRHAEGLHNVDCDYSIYDPKLTEKGIQQCKDNSDEYNKVDFVICSTAVRAIETALHLFPDKQIYATDLLLEYNTGIRCNCRNSLELQKEKFPMVNFDAYRVKPLDKEITWDDGYRRANRAMALISLLHYDDIAIVSHCNFIRNLSRTFGPQHKIDHMENCERKIIDFDPIS
jgi:broad specificity phosphatase PhoE